jgi:hypothetical protein
MDNYQKLAVAHCAARKKLRKAVQVADELANF